MVSIASIDWQNAVSVPEWWNEQRETEWPMALMQGTTVYGKPEGQAPRGGRPPMVGTYCCLVASRSKEMRERTNAGGSLWREQVPDWGIDEGGSCRGIS
jgi:hypothetical protein